MEIPDMKQIIFSSIAVAAMFTFVSCERHSWEDSEDGKGTKNLYKSDKDKKDHGDHKGQDH